MRAPGRDERISLITLDFILNFPENLCTILLFIEFGPKMDSGMVVRIGFVVLDGREHPKKRNLSSPSRIRGLDVIIIFIKKTIFEEIILQSYQNRKPPCPK